MKRLLLITLVWMLPNSDLAAAALTIPPAFRGEWTADLKSCGKGFDDSRLVIGSTTLSFYESGGAVRAMVPRGNFEITLILEMSEENRSWIAPAQYKLSVDGNKLSDTTNTVAEIVRYRCPKK